MSGWPTAPLGEVARLDRDMVSPEAIEAGTTYVGLEHIENGGEIRPAATVENGDLKSTKFAFTSKHILYGKLRPYLAKIALPDFSGVCTTEIIPIAAGAQMDRRFLAHFLRQPEQIELATARSTGANLPRLSPSELAKFHVPVPPLSEQRRIAAILDQADALRAKRRAALAQLDDLARAIFVEMFGAAPTWSTRWPCRPFEETMRDETSRSNKLQAGEFLSIGSFPVIDQGQSEIAGYCDDPAYLCVSSLPCVVFGDHTRAVKLVRKPFVIGADGAKVLVPCYGIEPVFLSYMMRFAPIPDLGYSRHMREVKRLSFPAPPSALQMEFARRIESLETHREVMSRSTVELNALFASLQHRAFRGEL